MLNKLFLYAFIAASPAALLTACSFSSSNFAPVTEISRTDPVPQSGKHTVTSGETLYSIAWRYGLDYQDLAQKNNIDAPYTVYVGQVINLRAPKPKVAHRQSTKVTTAKAVKANKPAKPVFKDSQKEPGYRVSHWRWPVKGRVVKKYSWKNKGIDIAGQPGTVVRAAAPGKVVYSGNGLKSYGNLIIIKHNSQYLSAYAYNRSIAVAEGQWVKAGQRIAEMGRDGRGKPVLHFEIRKNGKAINPLKLLKK